MAINGVPMAFNQGCRGIIPGNRVHGPFLYYTLKSRVPELNATANGTTFVELSRDGLAAVSVELPPLDTQRQIARFLDKKTAQIDGLIERIRNSVARLEEYRSAQITAAVTGHPHGAVMTLTAPTYFGHLRAYVNDRYVMHDGTDGEVVLREKYFPATGTRAKTRKIHLLLPGPGLAFKLDYDQVELQRRKSKPPLFHFLDDTAKPWSKRCDFVVFYVNRRVFHADCIEFKSKSLNADKILPQLRAGTSWVKSLKRTIEHYTGDKHRIRLRKFVFAENENPGPFIDGNRQLKADPSIRYYHFDEVQGQPLADLKNTSWQNI